MTEMLEMLIGSSVYDPGGAKIGKVKRVYVDNNSGSPTWVAVSTGLFSADALVPLAGAEHRADSGILQVQVEKDAVKTAPQLDHNGQISPQAEQELFDHYQIDPDQAAWDVYGRQPLPDQPPRADAGMVRSEERCDTGAEHEDLGMARMRTYLESEEETLRMPASGDGMRIRREPMTDPYAVDSADLGTKEPEAVPHEERLTDEMYNPEDRMR
ncbi:PRC-barrel domain-containing protein [Nocardia sp. NBC_00508]|uniref:PRC-barrel domain-containing protein n=1 Tax=Nocardia sp. NBC_00508 TaxID=2975992 RepID=UPI002E8078E1|nr:PRC-barrel domain-containing protein [Nocardia sp. NBC_00508]WUD65151.1 PRC-barrel domain-containing protein [Nocardia sp. NBC_00508]